ncbi:hypothetical protein SETIT_5G039700v2 [Setaria italica]|uniref:Protein TIFY n=2 Tax=Setaria TaxID=4554 RepID=K3XS39_SETIT|nr:hypothetical protein SETIT_5G039700v2 [Setaria italica]TKW12465.1 hypothetical protein SEVIR_5G037500v2 [Setaria viridis]
MAAEGSRSGRRSGRFTMTCACVLQRQRQARAGNVARLFQEPPPLPVAPAVENDGRTMQLFPVRAGAAMARQRLEMTKAPMTIFYGGQVIRVENVPADKGKQLMEMAQSVNNPPPPEKVVVVDVPDEEVVAEPSAAITANQARKLSVQRFLGKRKQRTDDPDDEEEASPSKKMDTGGDEPFEDVPYASWLSL